MASDPDPAALAAALSVRERAARLLAGITPGEWFAANWPSNGWTVCWRQNAPICHMRWTDGLCHEVEARIKAEAEFIAAAPQLVRDLLTEHAAIAAEHCDVHPHQVLSLMCEECFGEDLSDNAIAWDTKVEQLRAEVARLRGYARHSADCEMVDPRDVESLRCYINPPEVPERRETRCTCGLDDLTALLPPVQESSGGGGRTAEAQQTEARMATPGDPGVSRTASDDR